MVRRTKFRALGGSRMYNEAIRGRQNGNPGVVDVQLSVAEQRWQERLIHRQQLDVKAVQLEYENPHLPQL